MQALQFSSRPALALAAALALACGAVRADDVSDINKLMRGGQLPAALAKVDVALAQRPKDAQLRFVKGMILSEQGKTADAIIIFQKLTEDYPELPEPYNNLAVLHAAAGNYDKARVALERAIRTNQAYATAHENLGDVYAKLASQSYDKAIQLTDASQQPAPKSKLTMVRTLAAKASEPAVPGLQAAAAAQPASVPPKPLSAAAPAKPTPTPTPAPAAAPAPGAAPVLSPGVAPAAAPPAAALAKAKPAAPAPRPATPAVQLPKTEDSDGADVSKAVENWARAWSAQDMKTYLSAYGSNFQPPKGQNRKAWEADRTARIEGKGHIKVTVEAPQITVSGNTATVKFRQKYESDRLSTTGRKTLVLEKQGRNWLIRQEQSGG